MDDISEQTDIANEISEAISTSLLGGQTDFDEVCFTLELTGKNNLMKITSVIEFNVRNLRDRSPYRF